MVETPAIINMSLMQLLKQKEAAVSEENKTIINYSSEQMDYFDREMNDLNEKKQKFIKEGEELDEIQKLLDTLQKKNSESLAGTDFAFSVLVTAREMHVKRGTQLPMKNVGSSSTQRPGAQK